MRPEKQTESTQNPEAAEHDSFGKTRPAARLRRAMDAHSRRAAADQRDVHETERAGRFLPTRSNIERDDRSIC